MPFARQTFWPLTKSDVADTETTSKIPPVAFANVSEATVPVVTFAAPIVAVPILDVEALTVEPFKTVTTIEAPEALVKARFVAVAFTIPALVAVRMVEKKAVAVAWPNVDEVARRSVNEALEPRRFVKYAFVPVVFVLDASDQKSAAIVPDGESNSEVTFNCEVVTPPKNVTATEVVAPRPVTEASVSISNDAGQLVPSFKQTVRPFTKSCVVETTVEKRFVVVASIATRFVAFKFAMMAVSVTLKTFIVAPAKSVSACEVVAPRNVTDSKVSASDG